MKTNCPRLSFLLIGLLLSVGGTANAAPFGTAFTYQGRLADGTNAANNLYDLDFALFDAPAGGSQLGLSVTYSGYPVSNGLFTVTLDFGASPFNGDARWLQIQVRTNGGLTTPYTPLSPRQALTASPYALYALNVGTAVQGSNIVSGTVNSNALDTATQAQLALAGTGGGWATNGVTAAVTNQWRVDATNASLKAASDAFSGVIPIRITPIQFGAVCDGVTDDSIAISNMFNYVNAKGGHCVIDFNGKTNLYSSSPTAVNVPSVTIQNGYILFNSTNGYAIGHNAGAGDSALSGFTVQNMHIRRVGWTTPPNKNSVGINLNADHATGGTYYGSTLISGNTIENFWNLIEGGPNAGISITLNKLTSMWNGCIWFDENVASPDFINISLNDMAQDNSTVPPGPQQ